MLRFLKTCLLAIFPICILLSILLLIFDKDEKIRNKMNTYVCDEHPLLHELISALFALSMAYHLYIGFMA